MCHTHVATHLFALSTLSSNNRVLQPDKLVISCLSQGYLQVPSQEKPDHRPDNANNTLPVRENLLGHSAPQPPTITHTQVTAALQSRTASGAPVTSAPQSATTTTDALGPSVPQPTTTDSQMPPAATSTPTSNHGVTVPPFGVYDWSTLNMAPPNINTPRPVVPTAYPSAVNIGLPNSAISQGTYFPPPFTTPFVTTSPPAPATSGSINITFN